MKRFVRWALTPRLNTLDAGLILPVAFALTDRGHVVIGLTVAVLGLTVSVGLEQRFGGGAAK